MRTSLISIAASILMTVALAACGDDSGDDTTDIDAATAAPTCTEYCTTIQGACTEGNTQYGSMDQCMAVCAAWDVGTDMTGNTLRCRAYHATNAVAAPVPHCLHAGPGGDGTCGTNCEGLCAIAAHSCVGPNDPFAEGDNCATQCATLTDDEDYDITDTTGDTLACRLYHATVASTTPDPHCGHIDADSAGEPCAPAAP